MEKKIRIQKFDQEGRFLEDRMVSQDPEFASGPKGKHEGLLRVEFTLLDKADTEKAKVYLDQLRGALPLEAKKLKKLTKEPQLEEHREQLILDAMEKATDQDELIKYLRDHDFVFMLWDYMETFDWAPEVKDIHKEKYQWMIRRIKTAKNPASDKYDPMLIFGFQLIGERNEKIVIYLNNEFHKAYKVALPDKPRETFKKSGMMKFPPYMTEQEREKFRYEFRQYQDNPEKKFSKFYLRWREWVENVPALPQDKKE